MGNIAPNPDVEVPPGYIHYGPTNGGVTLPQGADFEDSMLLGGFMSSTGNNPYYPDGATSSGELSLGGSPYDTANAPEWDGSYAIGIDDMPQGGDDPNWGSTRDQLLNGGTTGGVPTGGVDPVVEEERELSFGGYPETGGILGPGDGYGGISDGQGGGYVIGSGGGYIPNPKNPVNDTFGSGGGAITGPAAQPGNIFDAITPEKTGYESSSNKDFYQRQMQEMRTAQHGQKLQDLAAAMRRQEAAQAPQGEPFGGDPWSWANLPDVRVSDGTATGGNYEIGLNPQFDWGTGTTNQQILQDLNPRLTDVERQYLQKNPLDDAPSFLDQAAFFDYSANKNPNDKLFSDALNKIYDNVWTPQGGDLSPTIPAGYALPTNG